MTVVKIRVPNGKSKPKEETAKQTKTLKKKRGFIWKAVVIVYNDIRYLPNKIFGIPVVKTMESSDTWEDWEGQL
jgi:hypothetical protein